MRIENKLALVWRDDNMCLAYPLDKVSIDLYKKLSKIFGSPVGRTETFIDLENYNRPKVNPENICINCGHSFSTEFNQLVCVLDENKHRVVGESNSCNNFN